jgi:hypothetical protein
LLARSGRPGGGTLPGLSAGASSRAVLSHSRGSSFVVGFRLRGSAVRAASDHAPDITGFHRESFRPFCPMRHENLASSARPRRPPTSCALRLRKPDRTSRPLTPSVARRPRGRRAPTRVSKGPEGHPSHGIRVCRVEDPSRQIRWDRRWFRTTDTERTRAPSIGSPRTSRSEWAVVALVVHLRGFAPHPVACHAPAQPRQGPGGRFRLSHRPLPAGYPTARELAGKMRLPDFCNQRFDTSTLRTARFPSARPDPLPCRRGPEHGRSTVRQRRPADPRVELRLTANLQLRRHHRQRAPARGFGPRHRRCRNATRSWRSLDRRAPPRGVSRQQHSPLRAEPVAWPLTSSVAAPPGALRPFGRIPPGGAARPASPSASSKTLASSEPGRLPSTSALSPAPARALPTACAACPTRSGRAFRPCPPIREDRGRGIVESSPPFSRLCRREPASDVPSPPEHEAGWLDPTAVKRPDQTPLVDFCNQFQSMSTTTYRPIPGSSMPARQAQLALGWEETSRTGLRPHPSRRPPDRMGVEPIRPRDRAAPGLGIPAILANRRGDASTRRRPRFHGSGAVQACCAAPRVLACRLGGTRGPRERGLRGRSFAPTRSARTPLVTEPWPHRLETPMRAASGGRSRARRHRRSRHTDPALANEREGRRAHVAAARARSREARRLGVRSRAPLARSPRARPARIVPVRLRSPDTILGRGPLHPMLREENRDPQTPEVPSIDEPPHRRRAGFRPRHRARALLRPWDGAFSTGCHQPVENTRRLLQPSARQGSFDEPSCGEG